MSQGQQGHGGTSAVSVSEHSRDEAARRATQPLTHHGRTLAAWVSSAIALVGFVIACGGFLLDFNWYVIWGGVVVILIAPIVGGILRKLGYGAKEK